jgi:hypothetical protein
VDLEFGDKGQVPSGAGLEVLLGQNPQLGAGYANMNPNLSFGQLLRELDEANANQAQAAPEGPPAQLSSPTHKVTQSSYQGQFSSASRPMRADRMPRPSGLHSDEAAGLGLLFGSNTPEHLRRPRTPKSAEQIAGRHAGDEQPHNTVPELQDDSTIPDPGAVIPAEGRQDSGSRPNTNDIAAILAAWNAQVPYGGIPDSDLPSTRSTNSDPADRQVINTTESIPQMSNPLLPPLDMSQFQAMLGAEELIQSATELATPSVGRQTPNPSIPHAFLSGAPGNFAGSPAMRVAQPRMLPPGLPSQAGSIQASALVKIGSHPILTPSSQSNMSPPVFPANGKEPKDLREVNLNLSVIKGYLSQNRASMKKLDDRLGMLETGSIISQIPRDNELYDKLDMLEGRLLELEAKVDEHHKVVSRFSFDRSIEDSMSRPKALMDNASFISDQSSRSGKSGTSSALQLAGGERESIRTRIDSLDDRVTDLEKSVPPSLNRPLEIEVVLLPWGRELRGLWISRNDHVKLSSARLGSQDSEDWMASRSVRSSSRMSMSLRNNAESGWSHEAIHEWAENADEWLVPKACGVKNVVYHRLKSRGFVRTVELNKAGAKEIREVITKAFRGLLAKLEGHKSLASSEDESESDEEGDEMYLGLEASFIPLRKVHSSSRLRFLSKPEMVTPALWTAEFLSSSVIMNAAGGQKRLFITHREAYLQSSGQDAPSWTWQMIKQQSRSGVGQDEVPEADAQESCWAEHPILDAQPLSVSTSFASHTSRSSRHGQSSGEKHDPTEVDELEGLGISPGSPTQLLQPESSSNLSSRALNPIPITPVSEFATQPLNIHRAHPSTPHPDSTPYLPQHQHQQQDHIDPRFLRGHGRTVSVPLSETHVPRTRSEHAQLQQPRSFSASLIPNKRIRSFETPSNSLIMRLPSFVPSPGSNDRAGTSVSKRRRLDRHMSADNASAGASAAYMLRSRSSRSVSVGKRTATPNASNAYPTPYSGGYRDLEDLEMDVDDGEVWNGMDDDGDAWNESMVESEAERYSGGEDVEDPDDDSSLDEDDDDDDEEQ